MIVVTIATKKLGYYECLKKQCDRLGLKLVTLGLNQKWTGFAMRYKLLGDFIKNLDENEIILYIDAYDVIITQGENIILQKFINFRKNIVFGLQNGFFSRRFYSNCNNNILNAGSYIGKVKWIKKLLKIVDNKIYHKLCNNDDQEVLNMVCNKKKFNRFFIKNIGIDIEQKIFYITDMTHYFHPKYLIDNDIGLVCRGKKILKGDIEPSVIHFAGGLDAKKYLKCLGLKDPLNIKFKKEGNFKFFQVLNILKNNNSHIYISIFVILVILVVTSIYRFKI